MTENIKIRRKDWEDGKKQLEANMRNLLITLEQSKVLLSLCEAKLSEFPPETEEKENEDILDEALKLVKEDAKTG